MKKKIILLLILILLITGCGKKKLIEIFNDNNYIDAGGIFGNYDLNNKIGKVYGFDVDDPYNNYFGYSEVDNTAVYYYRKGLIHINECILNVDDGSFSEECKDEEKEFLKKAESVFKEENKRLGITLDTLNIKKDELY